MLRYIHLPILLILLFSCSSDKKQKKQDSGLYNSVELKVIEHVIQEDSIITIKPVIVRTPTKINTGTPTITPAFSNISVAGSPIVKKVLKREPFTPGLNGIRVPAVSTVEIRKVPGRNRPYKKALPPGTINGLNKTFEYLDVEQGLPSSFIYTLIQDKRKNFWMGTNGDGVIKYDGLNFLQYTADEGLPGNWVRCILEDSKGNIWFGTDSGLAKFDGSDFFWVMDTEKEYKDFPRIDVRSLAEDSAGNLWIGTANYGLFSFDGAQLTNFFMDNNSGGYISDIQIDKKGRIWFCSHTDGVFVYNGQSFIQYKQNDGLLSNKVHCIAEDASGNLWMGTDKGLSKLDGTSFTNFTEAEGLCSNNITTITEDKDGNIWIGTSDNGTCSYNGKTFTEYNLVQGFRSNEIHTIFNDHSGKLFFGTGGGGVIIFSKSNFLSFGRQSIINQSHITCINEDAKGNTWFGTIKGSLIKYDGVNFYHYMPDTGFNGRELNSIVADGNGNLWFGGYGLGLFRYDGTNFFRYSDSGNILLRKINDLHAEKNGTIWIGSTNKILNLRGDRLEGFELIMEPSRQEIITIFEDKQSVFWLGTQSGSLIRKDSGSFRHYNLSKSPLIEILNGSDGHIWIACESDGLIKFSSDLKAEAGSGKIFLNYNKITQKENIRLRSLVKDREGYLWLGTNKGLMYFDNATPTIVRERKMFDFTQKDGLPGKELVIRSGYMDHSNRIWWGTTKGLTMVDLKTIQFDTTTPVVQLNYIYFNGKFEDFHHLKNAEDRAKAPALRGARFSGPEKFFNYPKDSQIPYRLNHLTFNFTAIDWSSPGKLSYTYTMDGLDEGWSEISDENSAEYRNIPYGHYTFKVKAIGASQKWSKEFEYPFTILPPWWHTWWFRSLLLAAFVSAIYAYIKYRTRSLLKRQQFLQSTVEKRTEELRIALTDKEALLKEIHHRVKNNLEVISSLLMLQTKTVTDEKAKAGLIEGQSRVQSIALIHHKLYRTDDLGSVELVGFSKDLFKQIKDVFNHPGTRVDFYINETEIWLDTDAAVPFGLIFNELITNAFKYGVVATSDNMFTMQATSKQEENTTHYHFVFRDNGPGLPDDFSPEKTSSLGMKVISLLTKQLDGTSKFYNDNGAVFELLFSKGNLPS